MMKTPVFLGISVATVVAGTYLATATLLPNNKSTPGNRVAANTLFEASDFDGNQKLEEDEFSAGFNIIMNRSDEDGDGMVTWKEFYNYAVRNYGPARQYVGIAQTRFTSGDNNSDGAIGGSEILRMQSSMFRLLDKNRNQELSKDELQQSAIGMQFTR